MWKEFLEGTLEMNNTSYQRRIEHVNCYVETTDRKEVILLGTTRAGILFEQHNIRGFYPKVKGFYPSFADYAKLPDVLPSHLAYALCEAIEPERIWVYHELAEQVPSLKQSILDILSEIEERSVLELLKRRITFQFA